MFSIPRPPHGRNDRSIHPGRSTRSAAERWSRHAEQRRVGERRLFSPQLAPEGIVWRNPFPRPSEHPILLIDDDEFGRHTLARILEGHGYRVLQATSGTEGMQRLHDVRPALVVLDLPLWRLDAWQVMEAWEDEPLWAGVPIIVVSAAESLPGLPRSVVAQFEKPFAVGDLLAEIHRNLAVQT